MALIEVRLILLIVLLCCSWIIGRADSGDDDRPLQCSLTDADLEEIDPALEYMEYDIGDGIEKTLVYVEPTMDSMYNGKPPASTKVPMKFNGFAGKFINMSNKPVTLHWEERKGGARHAMRNHNPFTASGTATFPNHRFVFTPQDDPKTDLITFVIGQYPENLYVYNPYLVEGDPVATQKNLDKYLKTDEERNKYEMWRKTLAFNEYYVNKTGRTYLANYLRDPPKHFMWRGDYFGQEHYVETRETQFIEHPPENLLQSINKKQKNRKLKDNEPRILHEYRAPGRLNMTLKVLSVAPRVFEIPNFLSMVEVEHILDLAGGINLKLSSTGDVNAGEKRIKEETARTRTSYNSWVPRERTPIIDSIYRRAADLMRIDEALFRYRQPNEFPERINKNTLSEDLQLVHYNITQEYTAHHDFGYARIDDGNKQGARFATLLLYLNEGMIGGETTFPRWSNAETFRELAIQPKIGNAALFYSQLPDGNLDDFSQHAAKPVKEGEKWLINLWVWDPVYN